MWSNRKCVCQTILSSNRSWDFFFFQFDFFAANSLVCASALSTHSTHGQTNEKVVFSFIITAVVCDSMANRNGLVACFRCANLEQEINGHIHTTPHTDTQQRGNALRLHVWWWIVCCTFDGQHTGATLGLGQMWQMWMNVCVWVVAEALHVHNKSHRKHTRRRETKKLCKICVPDKVMVFDVNDRETCCGFFFFRFVSCVIITRILPFENCS